MSECSRRARQIVPRSRRDTEVSYSRIQFIYYGYLEQWHMIISNLVYHLEAILLASRSAICTNFYVDEVVTRCNSFLLVPTNVLRYEHPKKILYPDATTERCFERSR